MWNKTLHEFVDIINIVPFSPAPNLSTQRSAAYSPNCVDRLSFWEMTMSNNQPIYLTEEGLQKVKDELEYLTTVRRREVAQMIAEAKAEGDISENAGYDEAKTAQGFLEGKIRELENILKHAQIITEDAAPANVVTLGRTVIVEEDGTDIKETYTIVGSREADPLNGRVSNESPMGKGLLGKKVGQKVKVDTPGGQITFKIIKVEWAW